MSGDVRAAVDQEPGSTLDACVLAGQRASSERRWSDAVKWYRRASELAPDDSLIAGNLAFAMSQDHQYEAAIEVLKQLPSREPRVAKWPYMIGYQHYMQQQWREAVDWFDRALGIKPDYMVVLYRKGYALLQLAQSDAGIEVLQSCIALWRKQPEPEQQRLRKCFSDACYQFGKALLADGWRLKAQRPLSEAVQHDPSDADKHYQLGKCLLANRRPKEAIEQFETADRIHPGLEYVLYQLGRAHAMLGETSQAEGAYGRIPEHRRRPYVLRALGGLLASQGRYEEARPILQRALRQEFDKEDAHYWLGLCLEAAGDLRRARQEYSEAVRIRGHRTGSGYPEAENQIKAIEAQASAPDQSADAEEQAAPTVGVIEHYNAARGFGFIRSRGGDRVFFHVTAVSGDVRPAEGMPIACAVSETSKGLRASWVRAVGEET